VCTLQAGLQASKKEREKAKRERKEARKLAKTPMPILTTDVHPRACTSEAEQIEVAAWIEQRKCRFPTATNIERRRREAAVIACTGTLPYQHVNFHL
jgi:hypothetical protein